MLRSHTIVVVCAVNLWYLKEIFKNVWAFVIASDAGNNARTAYIDLWMLFCFEGALAYLDVSLKTCKVFVRPLQAI